MVVLSQLLSEDVRAEILLNYVKIKTQQVEQKHKDGLAKHSNYTLCDTDEPFEIDSFIDVIRPILNRLKINFAIGFILRSETDVRYYYPSDNNGCIWKTRLTLKRK